MTPRLGQTPSQTVGPFFSMRLSGPGQDVIPSPPGVEPIVISGRVLDGAGSPVEDALIEVWQAGPSGRYNHPDDTRDLGLSPGFTGYARAATDFNSGRYRFQTVKPGLVPDAEGAFQAPHISLVVQARGMLGPLFTRMYFSDEDEANRDDLVLRSVPPERRATLIARLVEESDPREYGFDIRLQGEAETVFFEF